MSADIWMFLVNFAVYLLYGLGGLAVLGVVVAPGVLILHVIMDRFGDIAGVISVLVYSCVVTTLIMAGVTTFG